jgi:hypothetical protein
MVNPGLPSVLKHQQLKAKELFAMKNTKLVAAAAIVAMGGAVALTAQGRTDNFDYTGLDIFSVADQATRDAILCGQLSVAEQDKLGCTPPQ